MSSILNLESWTERAGPGPRLVFYLTFFLLGTLNVEIAGYFLQSLKSVTITLVATVQLCLYLLLNKRRINVRSFCDLVPLKFPSSLAGFVVLGYLTLDFLFLFTEKPIFNVTDALFYHIPRIANWYQSGSIHWIDSLEYRMNLWPRLSSDLAVGAMVFFKTLKSGLLPSAIMSLLLLKESIALAVAAVHEDQKPGQAEFLFWLVFSVMVTCTPFYLQLRAFQVDHVQVAILSSCLALLIWKGEVKLRIFGILISLVLSVGNKPTGLPFLPIGLGLMFLDSSIRNAIFYKKIKIHWFLFLFVSSCLLFISPFIVNAFIHGNPVFPHSIAIGPFHLPGGPNWVGEDAVQPGFQNILNGWRILLYYCLFSVGGFSVLAADVGGYGPLVSYLAAPAILGWLFSLKENIAIRKLSLAAFLFCCVNMVSRSWGRDGHPEARYFAIILFPLFLGAGLAYLGLIEKLSRRVFQASGILFAILVLATTFRVAAVPHASYLRDIASLPHDLYANFINSGGEKPGLKILAAGVGTRTRTGHMFGSALQHTVKIRGVPTNDYEPYFNIEVSEQVARCKNDVPNFLKEITGYDLAVIDAYSSEEVVQCYRKALEEYGWTHRSIQHNKKYELRNILHLMLPPQSKLLAELNAP